MLIFYVNIFMLIFYVNYIIKGVTEYVIIIKPKITNNNNNGNITKNPRDFFVSRLT